MERDNAALLELYAAPPYNEEKPSQGAYADMPPQESAAHRHEEKDDMPSLEDEENPYADMPPLESARQRAVEEAIAAAYIEYHNAAHAASIATATHSHEEKAAAE